ncbi:MAG: Holliday junction branch migration protein RuvA, partial [Acidobacteriota bacterium]
EKGLFLKLISISGIGPKLAVAMMSGGSAEDLVGAIQQKDVRRLTLVPGIGKKTAERIVLELSDKLADLGPAAGRAEKAPAPRPPRSVVKDDVVSALVNLGYKPALAEEVVRKIADDADFETALREALRSLAPG